MECLACKIACPTDAIEIEDIASCIRLIEVRPHTWMIEEKCNKCGNCIRVCPMGDIALSAEGCSHCIICKSRPNCIVSGDNRASLLNSIGSITRFIALMPRLIFL